MDRSIGAAARLPESDRRDLAIEALAGSETVSDLAARHGVSRNFVYEQTHKARTALDDAFLSAAPEDEVLFRVDGHQSMAAPGDRRAAADLPQLVSRCHRVPA
jgi:transposase-like protein